MKRFLLLLLILSPCFALSTNANFYSKGDSIVISANELIIGSEYTINGYSSGNLVFSKDFIAVNENFNYTYPISFLDPSGDWQIFLGDDYKNITVSSSRDSSAYLVSFISPASRDYMRTDFFNLTINLTQAGDSISGASVQSFDDNGRRILLNEISSGVYSAPYSFGVNSIVGVKSLVVLAFKEGLGGQGVVNVTVNKARINLLIVQPELSEYSIGSLLNVKVSASYPNGSVTGFNVNAMYGDSIIPLSFVDGFYVGEYKLSPADDGLRTLSVSASDIFGNEGFISKKISGSSLIVYYLISNLLYILIGLAGVIVIVFFTKKKVSSSINVKKLGEKKKELMSKKKRLQEDYFVNNSISKSIYDDETSKIDEELNIIGAKMRDAKKQ